MNPSVVMYIGGSSQWPDELRSLREVLLGCGITEEIKWGKPCYGHSGKNIAILQEMKSFLALMFFKGALIADPAGVLHEQNPKLNAAFAAFTKGRQREYDLHGAGAKQSTTRHSRIDKFTDRVLSGKGLRY